MKKIVNVIDCGLGNISSVLNAFEALGCDVKTAYAADDLLGTKMVVLPGVGAFGDGMMKLKEKGLDKAIVAAVRSGAKILGICLGMQLLFDKSYEFGEHEGLHLIKGEVKKMMVSNIGLRIPHIGWNDTLMLEPDDPLVNGLPTPACFYYVNSFSCYPENENTIVGIYEYGNKYVGIVRDGRLMGVQFHPEKSQKMGLRLLENFLRIQNA